MQKILYQLPIQNQNIDEVWFTKKLDKNYVINVFEEKKNTNNFLNFNKLSIYFR